MINCSIVPYYLYLQVFTKQCPFVIRCVRPVITLYYILVLRIGSAAKQKADAKVWTKSSIQNVSEWLCVLIVWKSHLLSCHSWAHATCTESCKLLTRLRASIALNSMPKPSVCWMRNTLSPKSISGRDGMCISSANLHKKPSKVSSAQRLQGCLDSNIITTNSTHHSCSEV